MVVELNGLTYEERLSILELPTLESRRERGNFISVYTMINGLEVVDRELFEAGCKKHKRALEEIEEGEL